MYLIAFGVTWLLFRRESTRIDAPWTEEDSANFFLWAIVGVLIGGRLGGTLIYEPTDYYWRKPWFIIWPFDEAGHFVGFQGMSFHGGFVGVIVSTLIWCKVHKQNWLRWADVVAVSAPLGYTFGRFGNFINGELWGKVSTAPWAMVFPYAERFPAKEQWVQNVAAKVGIPISSMNDMVNLPRHPSQLYEALFEGLVLWLILWFIVRKRKSFKGFALACYAVGYGVARFVIEYFREPDAGLGYIIKLGNPDAPPYIFSTPFNFSMGQILSFLMVVAALVFLVVMGKRAKRLDLEVVSTQNDSKKQRSNARKLRKKIHS
jgi:phosphatidylglycerol:prolipoprotein diacylglycerol transferase